MPASAADRGKGGDLGRRVDRSVVLRVDGTDGDQEASREALEVGTKRADRSPEIADRRGIGKFHRQYRRSQTLAQQGEDSDLDDQGRSFRRDQARGSGERSAFDQPSLAALAAALASALAALAAILTARFSALAACASAKVALPAVKRSLSRTALPLRWRR